MPPRALALRTVFAELERLRHHAAVITAICNSTALAVATAQAALIEEDLLRLSCEAGRHRYLFGVMRLGGVAHDLSEDDRNQLARSVGSRGACAPRVCIRCCAIRAASSIGLRRSALLPQSRPLSYGLVGPVARASGLARDIRKLFPYADYQALRFRGPRRT